MVAKQEILSCEGLSKSFGSTIAVDQVNLSVRKGDIVGLAGENGAGKTTLIKLLAGEVRPDKGRIVYKGLEVKWNDAHHALKNGLSLAHQHPLLVASLNAVDNIYLGQEFTTHTLLNEKKAFDATLELLKLFPIFRQLDLDKKVADMSAGEKEVVEILKAFSYNPDILILDEPTASLPQKETKALMELLKYLNVKKELTIIYISHKLEELFDICHKIVVLRNGKNVGTLEQEEFNKDRMIQMMINQDISTFYPPKDNTVGVNLLRVHNLNSQAVKDVSFSVNAGEIVGFYGLMGAGMTETAESICGHRPVVGGKIIFENEEIKRLEVSTMIRKGVYFIPSDRHRYSIFRDFSIRENLTIAHLADLFPEIVLNNQKEKRLVDEKITQFGIKCSDCNQRMDELSGGNQQKVVVTRWLLKNCKVLIVDDPTVGIDIGAKHDIYLMMRKLNQMGVGIILISSEIAEVLSMSDRIYTMRDGAITAELKADQITQENILQNIL